MDWFKQLFTSKSIDSDVAIALQWKIPDHLEVVLNKENDIYVATVTNLKGCITQASTGLELVEMVNDAMYTYLEIPEQYRSFMPKYLPNEEARSELRIEIPSKYLDKQLVLSK